jgi:hypothetical protein
MSVLFQQYSENQTNKIENDQMNYYEEIINIPTQSNNEYLTPQELKTKTFKNDEIKNIKVPNSHLMIPNILDTKKDCYSITKSLLSKYCLVWIILIICTIAILLNVITSLALNTGYKELKSKES